MFTGKLENSEINYDRWKKIQHRDFNCRVLISPHNRRITVYDFGLDRGEAAERMLKTLEKEALTRGLDKIWLKAEPKHWYAFLAAGMQLEATIPGYYQGIEPALVLAKYLSAPRQIPSINNVGEQIIKLVKPGGEAKKRDLPAGITLKWGKREHTNRLARLYKMVFSTYPFPVFDPYYLSYTMSHDVIYITAWSDGELAAAASAEINRPEKNAELTDFATLPAWRGHGLASRLLAELENRLKKEGIKCFYTIARSSIAGMNKVFAGAGYEFRGLLVKNCNIGGGLEDMNVWSKTN